MAFFCSLVNASIRFKIHTKSLRRRKMWSRRRRFASSRDEEENEIQFFWNYAAFGLSPSRSLVATLTQMCLPCRWRAHGTISTFHVAFTRSLLFCWAVFFSHRFLQYGKKLHRDCFSLLFSLPWVQMFVHDVCLCCRSSFAVFLFFSEYRLERKHGSCFTSVAFKHIDLCTSRLNVCLWL